MLSELGLWTTTFATHWTPEHFQAGVHLHMSHTMLLECIRSLESFATVITQVRSLVVVHVVHVSNKVLLPPRLVCTLHKQSWKQNYNKEDNRYVKKRRKERHLPDSCLQSAAFQPALWLSSAVQVDWANASRYQGWMLWFFPFFLDSLCSEADCRNESGRCRSFLPFFFNFCLFTFSSFPFTFVIPIRRL